MSVGLDPPGTGLTTLLCFPVLRPRLSLTPKDFRPISGNPATELYQNICFGHSLSIIITGQLPLYYGKNSKSNLRTLLGWLEYFVAPPANTCAQQRLQTRWGRRGLWGQSPQASILVPAAPFWSGQVLCWIGSSFNSHVHVLTPITLFRNRVVTGVIS